MLPERVQDGVQVGAGALPRAGQGVDDVGEEPGAPLAAAPHDHPVCPRGAHHGRRVVPRPDVPVAQDRDVHGLLEGGDPLPVGVPGVVLLGGAGVQGDGGDTGVLGGAPRLQEGLVLGVDANAHLHGHRDGVAVGGARGRLGGTDRLTQDRGQQVALPGQGRAPAPTGDLGHRAAEVEVNVVRQVLLHQDPHRLPRHHRVHAVELDGADPLGGVGADHGQGPLAALHQRPGGDHLGDVQAGRGRQGPVRRPQGAGGARAQRGGQGRLPLLAAQAPEGGVGDPGHGGEPHGDGDGERPDAQRGEGAGRRGWHGGALRRCGVHAAPPAARNPVRDPPRDPARGRERPGPVRRGPPWWGTGRRQWPW